jgi:hypothetical protein
LPAAFGELSMMEKPAEGVDSPQAEARSMDLTVPALGRHARSRRPRVGMW